MNEERIIAIGSLIMLIGLIGAALSLFLDSIFKMFLYPFIISVIMYVSGAIIIILPIAPNPIPFFRKVWRVVIGKEDELF